ncbi:Signal transduction histidine kinase [Faunimonas pinastri]|uniref:histidine kinase n=1 Tax=Faunimonas pinastri TaxID=1855383 RepID=A0A1H9QV29_9HYPH|nr:HAMP domain-containing sensor histidine kinase [Faunimonas pinastri]SER64308.1 Signal transduction histidine kinase [Faunimonas pinastri]
MFSKPLPEVVRTTSFRVAMAYTGLLVAAIAVIMGTTYLVASREMKGIYRREITLDTSMFRSAFREGGIQELRHSLQDRAEGANDDSFFMLIEPGEKVSVGDLPASLWCDAWCDRRLDEATVKASPELSQAASMNSDNEVILFSYGMSLGPYRVLAGRNSHILDETQEIIFGCFVVGTLAMAFAALVGGYFISRTSARRVAFITTFTRRVVAGRFDLRLPITQRRDELDRLSADINIMLARIDRLMESLKQVSTDIAHDLRTPLARLRQKLDVARRQDKRFSVEEILDQAVDEVDGIIETFNALLRIAQVEAGARRARFRPINLSELVENICDIYRDVAFDAGHRLDSAIEPTPPIEGDVDLLTQVIANLIENAIVHAPPPAKINVAVRHIGTEVTLAIADDGPGIPETEREKVFQRLYRLDRSRTTPGNGLGLALVAAIVELHGTRIEIGDNLPGLIMRLTFNARNGQNTDS